MMTVKVMFSLPDQLMARIRAAIPARERSKVVAALFEKELDRREKRLYACAKELEESKGLKTEMATWEQEFGQAGLDDV